MVPLPCGNNILSVKEAVNIFSKPFGIGGLAGKAWVAVKTDNGPAVFCGIEFKYICIAARCYFDPDIRFAAYPVKAELFCRCLENELVEGLEGVEVCFGAVG